MFKKIKKSWLFWYEVIYDTAIKAHLMSMGYWKLPNRFPKNKV